MQTLRVDIETRSGTKIKLGTPRYVEDPEFRILLFQYKVDDQETVVIDLASDEEIPCYIMDALFDPNVTKYAFNAFFERTCLAKFLGMECPPEQWRCTMVKCLMVGLPGKLEKVSQVMKLHNGKLDTGKRLITKFCVPRKPTKTNAARWNEPADFLQDWEDFKAYGARDVDAEYEIDEKLKFFNIPAQEQELWNIDQKLNDRGVTIDLKFVKQAIAIYNDYFERLLAEAVEITGLDNPNSTKQLISWLSEEMDMEVTSVAKDPVLKLKEIANTPHVERMLSIRQELAMSSIKKYFTMADMISADGKYRGLLQHYGGARTGRFAGRGVQVHNLTKHRITNKELAAAREWCKAGNGDLLEMIFGNIPDILSQMIRTAFVPAPDSRFLVSDFKAIEARVIAWLCDERWRMDVFAGDGKVYEASASKMFKVPIETIEPKHPNYSYRAVGKVAELALGFQGGWKSLITMGAEREGLVLKTDTDKQREEKLDPLVKMWRTESPNIVKTWYAYQDAAFKAIGNPGQQVTLKHGVTMQVVKAIFYITLPSGRQLCYISPKIEEGKFGPTITFQGMGSEGKGARIWGKQYLYGGLLVQNTVQAIARDCLCESMIRITKAGYTLAFHVHDELVLEVPNSFGSLEEVNEIMGQPIPWAPGLPLTADSYETLYYKKD